ncbi:hypothetical protein DVH05_003511 [Phytophthora capsici]|nr:hypothetical protein DVH05_003511 [Phytophthora capsici]|eukprot:jgi/Phyca11/109432/e_gw1.16.672.1
MRLSLVVLAAVLFASGTAVSSADPASVAAVHSSRVLSDEDKRFLRRHPTEHDNEERAFGQNMFAALKLSKMKTDAEYRVKVFHRWKKHGYTADDVAKHVPAKLADQYSHHVNTFTTSGWVMNPLRIFSPP